MGRKEIMGFSRLRKEKLVGVRAVQLIRIMIIYKNPKVPHRTRYNESMGKMRHKTLKHWGSVFNINTDHSKFKNTISSATFF